MNLRPLALALALLVLTPPLPVEAVPTVWLKWGTCPSPNHTNIDASPDPSGIETITISATGLSGAVTAVQVGIMMRSPGSGLGDAWRFDPSGCEGGERLHINRATSGMPCPFLSGDHLLELSAFEYSDVWDEFGRARLTTGRRFDAVMANPESTYTIAQFEFEHGNLGSRPDTCGCLERPVCIYVTQAVYLDGAGNERYFFLGQEYLTWKDPTNASGCPGTYSKISLSYQGADVDTSCVAIPTPAHARSWGSIKASYRAPDR
jgi:hypothetical protein